MKHLLSVVFCGILLFGGVQVFAADTTKVSVAKKPAADAGITVPGGFKAVIFADTVGRSRHLTVDPLGNVFVKLERLKNGNGIVKLQDNNQDGKADKTASFGNFVGTGIAV